MTTQKTPPLTGPAAAGATLHLGGDAYCTPDLLPLLVPADTVTPYPGNARRHDQPAITASVRELGVWRAAVAQKSTGHVLVGNGQHAALLELGAEQVPVTWRDCPDSLARAIVIRDNHVGDLASNDDVALLDLLRLAQEDDTLALTGMNDGDLAALAAIADGTTGNLAGDYTRKADPIHYTPTAEEPPHPSELVDRGRANELLRQISEVELPGEVRDFLTAGAQRHLRFDYSRIAEFYAHADPEVQALMEASALVIIDYDDAIRSGYARLSEKLRSLLDLDLAYRGTLDRRSDSLRESLRNA